MDKELKWKTADPFLYGLLKAFAAENRNHQTEAERVLWEYLKNRSLGVRFRRQYIISNYIADFVCMDRKLIIEVDGSYHFTTSQMQNDIYRTEELEKLGFVVLRFRNEEVLFEIENTLNKIEEYI